MQNPKKNKTGSQFENSLGEQNSNQHGSLTTMSGQFKNCVNKILIDEHGRSDQRVINDQLGDNPSRQIVNDGFSQQPCWVNPQLSGLRWVVPVACQSICGFS
jgi:hypothetical protein